jgi:hypothetical protein
MKGCRVSTVLRWGSLLALLTLNACSSSGEDEDDFQFGKVEMESALHGTWLGTWTPVNGTESALELVIRAPDEPGMRMACGNRTFSEAGPALSEQCVTETSLTVSATATIPDEDPIDLDGYAITPSMILSNAYLELGGEASPFRLDASWDAEQGFTSCSAFGIHGDAVASCTLDERR